MFGRIEDLPSTVTNFTENGKCTECGQCCSSLLPIAASEIKAIRKYIRKHYIKPFVHKGPVASPMIDLTCPFLNDSKPNHKCMVYEVRPLICRIFICSKEMNLLDAMKIKNHFATEEVQLVNMREIFCRED